MASQELTGNQDSTQLCLLPRYGEVRAGIDGVNAIFYRHASIAVVAQGCFSLSECPDSIMKKGWDAAYPRRAVWAVMRHRSSGKQFVIINTHLDHIGAVSRREGAKLIVQRISAISHGLPTIVTGDFNVEADSEAYAIITSGGLCDAQKNGSNSIRSLIHLAQLWQARCLEAHHHRFCAHKPRHHRQALPHSTSPNPSHAQRPLAACRHNHFLKTLIPQHYYKYNFLST